MEYFLIIFLEVLGIGFKVGLTLWELDKLKPDDTLSDVFKDFWNKDRVTVFISALVLVLNVVVHFIIANYAPSLTAEIEYYNLWAFGAAFVLGYAGQWLLYKALGKAVKMAETKLGS
jgi:hypothetical protein